MATPLATRLATAIAVGMRIFGQGAFKATGKRFFLVTSEHYASNNKVYIVACAGGHLTCNCPSLKPCKHIALVAQYLNAGRRAEALRAEMERQAALDQPDDDTDMDYYLNRY